MEYRLILAQNPVQNMVQMDQWFNVNNKSILRSVCVLDICLAFVFWRKWNLLIDWVTRSLNIINQKHCIYNNEPISNFIMVNILKTDSCWEQRNWNWLQQQLSLIKEGHKTWMTIYSQFDQDLAAINSKYGLELYYIFLPFLKWWNLVIPLKRIELI